MKNKLYKNMATLSIISLGVPNLSRVCLKFNRGLRHYSSALFIPGNRATETFSLLSPVLDFDKRFSDIKKLQHEFDYRGLNIDASELKNSWEFYKNIEQKKKIIETRREDVAWKTKKLFKKKTLDDIEKQDVEKLKILGTILKHEAKIIREALWEIEETIIPYILKIPNELDEKTPVKSVIMHMVNNKREPLKDKRKNHIEIGKSLKLIEYKNSFDYFLCNKAALFEIGITTWASKLLSDSGINRVSGADFARSLVVEGTGIDHEDPFKTFFLDENASKDPCNRLHLVGGATLTAFIAMHTKQLINPKHIPVSYYTIGRQYQPVIEPSHLQLGLFGVCQSTAVSCMGIVKDTNCDEHNDQFEKLLNITLKIYNDLGVHYRVVLKSIGELHYSESLRMSFEMWSSSCQNYIEVGHLSMYGNYFSKRLLIAYQTPTGRGYPAIISGTILSIPKLLGCLLEEDIDKFNIPSCITEYMPIDTIEN